jgi:subtilisin family serine protease
VTTVARPLRVLVPVLAAAAIAATAALPAAVASANPQATVTSASQWWLGTLRVPAALRAAPSAGQGVTVAVLSTGVDATHPDLAGSVTTGPDFSATGRKQGSAYWGEEGTAVASLIAGHGHGAGGKQGITGIAPAARILSVQVTLEYDDPLTADAAVAGHLPDAIAEGILWAVSHGATVIALPLDPGTLGPGSAGNAATGGSAGERAAIVFARNHNALLVAPAGDNGAEGNAVDYPAAYPGVIAVGATTRDGGLSPFSNTGSYVTLTAPGAGITPDPPVSGGMTADPAAGLPAADPDGGYEPLATSDMSAALTAGVAALIRSRYPWLTVPEVTQALGHGALDAQTALNAAAAIAAAHPAPTPSAAPSTAPAAAPTARPVGAGATHRAASAADPGHVVRSLVVDLAAVAGVLIAGLVGAIALTRFRRRPRTARSPGHARHARGTPGALPASIPARVVIWPSMPESTPSAGGMLVRASGSHRRPQPTGNPPWQPASPPRDPASPPVMLPAQTMADKPSPPLAPWEQSPEEFAVAPVIDEQAPWPISTTGPMYVWNPATTTGPLIAIPDDEDPPQGPPWQD